MWEEYAKDPRMKRNLGIGRRLAPLVDNDRRVAELLHALLFSFPGSPVLYYGDEIGMGDNIYLGDRDGVRTPMQWSPDRNGGFSSADFAQLYLPPLMDPVYGYQAVNVEAGHEGPELAPPLDEANARGAQAAPRVRVRRVRRGLRGEPLRARVHQKPSRGYGGRRVRARTVLCVCNLSRLAQPAELPLQRWQGKVPIELLGRVPFPRIGELPYFVTLAPYSFYWFELVDSPGSR